MKFTKLSNRLDDALIAGHITHDQYLAAGGRTPEAMLSGLRRGSDALVNKHKIREIRSARDLVSPEQHRRVVLGDILRNPGKGAGFGTPDYALTWALKKPRQKGGPLVTEFDDAALDDLYTKLDPKGHILADVDKEVAYRTKQFKRMALENFVRMADDEARNAHAMGGSHIYTPTANTDTLGTKLRNLVGKKRNPFEADFEAELIRRHEIDESRFRDLGKKSKKTLQSFGHVHPRVILNEHASLARASKGVRDAFINVRNSNYEAPAYSIASGGNFEYGKGFNDVPRKPGGGYDFSAAKRSIENSIADEVLGDRDLARKARQETVQHLVKKPSFLDVLRNEVQGTAKNSIVGALSKAPDSSLLGRLSNFIIKHSEYSPGQSPLKTAYYLGAQEALRQAQ